MDFNLIWSSISGNDLRTAAWLQYMSCFGHIWPRVRTVHDMQLQSMQWRSKRISKTSSCRSNCEVTWRWVIFNPVPSHWRSRWWGQSLSDPFCSTALGPSHPLGIVGVPVHPPHQRLALASRDPCEASPATETQSRAPYPRICKWMVNVVTFDLLIPSVGTVTLPSSFLRWSFVWALSLHSGLSHPFYGS